MERIKQLWYGPPAPWRTLPSGNKKTYLEEINKFEVNKEDVQHIQIMLYGPTGAGKSSFINSVETALRGRITCQALPDSTGGSSFTQKFQTHTLKKDSGIYPFVFTDIMGHEKGKNEGVSLEDVQLAFKGHVKGDYKINPKSPLSKNDPHYNDSPTINDKTHLLVCVIPAGTFSLMSKDFMEKIRAVRLAASDLGIPQIAVLTKIDEACREVHSNIKKVYTSATIKKKTDEVHAVLGFPLNCIFPVKNYHNELFPNDDIDMLILLALKQMIDFGNDFVDKMCRGI